MSNHSDENKVVVITGGAKGIGRYIAQSFARTGARIAIGDIDADRMAHTLGELTGANVHAIAVPTDVRDDKQVERLMNSAIDTFGRLDVVVNNAGIAPHFAWGVPRWPDISAMDDELWTRVLDTNLLGTFHGTKHALRHMIKQGSGHVLNVHGGGGPASAPYVVSKDAIVIFTRVAAQQVHDAGVVVAAVRMPVGIATEDAPEEARQRMPGPDWIGDRYVLASRVGLELSGKLLDLKDGEIVGEDWPPPPRD